MSLQQATPSQTGKYYRFQHEQPQAGELVHCFTNLQHFRGFVRMMRQDDPDARRMKTWEVTGQFVRADEDDAIVRVAFAREIHI
jgi:hypothetical protein